MNFQELKAEIKLSDKYFVKNACLELVEKCEEIHEEFIKTFLKELNIHYIKKEDVKSAIDKKRTKKYSDFKRYRKEVNQAIKSKDKGQEDYSEEMSGRALNNCDLLDNLKQELFGDVKE